MRSEKVIWANTVSRVAISDEVNIGLFYNVLELFWMLMGNFTKSVPFPP